VLRILYPKHNRNNSENQLHKVMDVEPATVFLQAILYSKTCTRGVMNQKIRAFVRLLISIQLNLLQK